MISMVAEHWIWGLIGTMGLLIGALVTGLIIPRSTYRDMCQERDYYRAAAQECANATIILTAQLRAALGTGAGDHA